MHVISENQASSLSIEVTGTELIRFPGLNLSVSVSDEGFSGSYGEIWVGLDEFQQFISDLRNCELTRNGIASLSSFSPGELELVIENSDSWGHFLLRCTLSRIFYSSMKPLTKTVSGGFDLDAEYFAQIVAEFVTLLSAANSKS